MPNTIELNVRNVHEKEYALKASASVIPGMLCELSLGEVRPHSNASVIPAPVLVAVEMPIRSGSGIDDAYDEDGEAVPCHYAQSGDELYMFLAAGEEVDSLDDRLGSDAAGALQVATTYAFARPLELVDNSAGYTAVRIRVEVL